MNIEIPSCAFRHEISNLPLNKFDIGGVLYHANYFHLFEEAREALLRTQAIPCSEMASRGEFLAIAEAKLNFEKPISYGMPVSVFLWCVEQRRTSVQIEYKITSPESAEPLHSASTRLVFIQKIDEKLKPSRLSEKLVDVFSAITS